MNPLGTKESVKLFSSIKDLSKNLKKNSIVICPPSIYISSLSKLVSSKCMLGAQNAYIDSVGSHTGEVSPNMLKELKVTHVILGHSERRLMGETNELINQKIKASLKAKIIPILCVGERERTGDAWYLHAVKTQLDECLLGLKSSNLKDFVIAYEPVWAIGKDATRVAVPSECEEMVIYIRKVLSDMFGAKNAHTTPILYGGSVDSKDAQDFLLHGSVDGFLVGRASLNPKEFGKIMQIAESI